MQTVRSYISQDKLFLLLIVVVGFLFRLDFLQANHFVIDSDEAIVGLMAKHVLEGREIPVFYYGQHYMGSFEALVVAGMFKLFGVSSAALKLVPLLFSLALIVVVYLLGCELAGMFVGRLAAAFCAVPPSALMTWSSMARGGFIEIVFVGACALLLTLRWWKDRCRSDLSLVGIWLLLGFGWWVNNQIIYFIVPIGMTLLMGWIEGRRSLRPWALAATAFFVGGFPFWIYNFMHSFVTFEMFRSARAGAFAEHIYGLFATALPILLGGKRFWHTEDVFFDSSIVIGGFYAALLVALMFDRWRGCLRLFVLRLDRERPVEIFIVFCVATLGIFTLSSFGYLVQAPRYLLPLYVGLFVLLAYLIARIRERLPVVAWCVTGLVLVFNLLSCYLGERAIAGEPLVFNGQRVSKDQSELVGWLRAHGIKWVQTNYWIGYRLAFETNEEIRFVIFQAPEQIRIASYQEEGLRGRDRFTIPFVLVPAQGALVKSALQTMGYAFAEARASGYVVLYDIVPTVSGLKNIDPAGLVMARSGVNGGEAAKAIDGDLETRWGSAGHQQPGMVVEFELRQPKPLRGFYYELGKWLTDYPRALEIELEDDAGTRRTVLDAEHYAGLRYCESGEGGFVMKFQPAMARKVIFRQLGEDPIFDWSIAELTFYE